MSSAPLGGFLLALALGLAAMVSARLLLAYVARREPEEAGASLETPPAIVLVVVVTTTVLLLLWQRPFTAVAVVQAGWVAALAVIFTVDLRVRYILDLWTAPLAVLAIIAAVVLPHPAYQTLLSALLGGAAGFLLFGAFYGLGLLLFRQPALGLGDVKLAALLGLIVGSERVLTAIFVGAMLGGVASLLLVLFRRARLGDAPAYGTYLTLGGYIALLEAAGLGR